LLQVAKAEVSLLSESVMTCLSEVFGTKLDLSDMLLSIEIPADFHDSVEVMTFTVDLNGFLVLTGLNVEVGSFLPVIGITLEFGLLNQN